MIIPMPLLRPNSFASPTHVEEYTHLGRPIPKSYLILYILLVAGYLSFLLNRQIGLSLIVTYNLDATKTNATQETQE
jgi:hypothetical protein